MQTSSMAQKVKVEIDGKEYPGLVKLGEINLEKGSIEVPTFSKIITIDNGVQKMPVIPFTYETRRNTATRKFIRDWFNNGEEHTVVIILCDADGVEFERQKLTSCRCRVNKIPETSAESPTYAQMSGEILPYDLSTL